MPYPNIPKHLQSKMERCVAKVKAKGGVKNAYAVCYRSLMGSKGGENPNSTHEKIAQARLRRKK